MRNANILNYYHDTFLRPVVDSFTNSCINICYRTNCPAKNQLCRTINFSYRTMSVTGRLFSGLQEGYSIFIKTLAYTRLICDNLDMQEETTYFSDMAIVCQVGIHYPSKREDFVTVNCHVPLSRRYFVFFCMVNIEVGEVQNSTLLLRRDLPEGALWHVYKHY